MATFCAQMFVHAIFHRRSQKFANKAQIISSGTPFGFFNLADLLLPRFSDNDGTPLKGPACSLVFFLLPLDPWTYRFRTIVNADFISESN